MDSTMPLIKTTQICGSLSKDQHKQSGLACPVET